MKVLLNILWNYAYIKEFWVYWLFNVSSFCFLHICKSILFQFFPILLITEYWALFPVLYSRSLLTIYFIYFSMHGSIPVFQKLKKNHLTFRCHERCKMSHKQVLILRGLYHFTVYMAWSAFHAVGLHDEVINLLIRQKQRLLFYHICRGLCFSIFFQSWIRDSILWILVYQLNTTKWLK